MVAVSIIDSSASENRVFVVSSPSCSLTARAKHLIHEVDLLFSACLIVLGSPVTGPEKDRDWTELGPIRDRKFLGPMKTVTVVWLSVYRNFQNLVTEKRLV